MSFIEALIPIFVSCVMPVAISGLIAWVIAKKSEHKKNVMIKAIENGMEIDPNLLMNVNSKVRSTRMKLVSRLGSGVMLTLMGLMFILCAAFDLASFAAWGYYPGFSLLAVGIGLLVSFFFGMKFLKSQIEAEEKDNE